jgi:hypothetical protein
LWLGREGILQGLKPLFLFAGLEAQGDPGLPRSKGNCNRNYNGNNRSRSLRDDNQRGNDKGNGNGNGNGKNNNRSPSGMTNKRSKRTGETERAWWDFCCDGGAG